MDLFMGNLPLDLNSEGLKNLVNSYAFVQKARVIYKEEVSRGFGFVTVPESEGNSVIEKLNGYFFQGKKLRVKKANSQEVPKRVFISKKWREKADEKL